MMRLKTTTSMIAIGLMSVVWMGTANAETTIPVDMASTTATKHEIAVLQVLSEICPPMLNDWQRTRFDQAYDYELKQLMPTISNPQAAVRYLSTQQDYKVVLSSMRDWTMGFSDAENLALCQELATSKYPY